MGNPFIMDWLVLLKWINIGKRDRGVLLKSKIYCALFFFQAMHQGASDIHFYRKKDRVLIFYRIDGKLIQMQSLDLSVAVNLISQLKLRANLDISEFLAHE